MPFYNSYPCEVFRGKAAADRRARPLRSRVAAPPRPRRYLDARGKYRVFNAAGYRFYRSVDGPPVETSTPFATSESLPHTPAETFADGAWFLSVSYFNGAIDSGFLPLGPAGETYLRLELADGSEVEAAPLPPLDWRLERAAGGVVRVCGVYFEAGAARAEQWAIACTDDGSTPPADAADAVKEMPTSGLAVLHYELPAAADAATVKVRLQTRRNDGTISVPVWRYSQASTVKTIVADAAGPAAPLAADRWAGPLPESSE